MKNENKELNPERSIKTEFDNRRNARYKRDREEKMKKKGFINSKLYLGRDTYTRLAAIHKAMRGDELPAISDDQGKKDIEAFSNMISYCIVKTYKEMFIKKGKCLIPESTPDIEPAKTKEAQRIYNIYQRISYQNHCCTLSDLDLSHKTIDIRCIYALNEDKVEISKPVQKDLSKHKRNQWTAELAKDFLHLETLNKMIRTANEEGVK